MKDTRCVLRIQLDRNEAMLGSFKFFKEVKKKKKKLTPWGEPLTVSPLWWSWLATDLKCLLGLPLVNYLCRLTKTCIISSGMCKFYLGACNQEEHSWSLLTQVTRKAKKTPPPASFSSGGINLMMKFWSTASMKEMLVIPAWCGLGEDYLAQPSWSFSG